MSVENDPPRIRTLAAHVVARMAAGEVATGVVALVKELVENSLDAGSRTVRVALTDGGLTRLVVQDDGRGIRRDDMALACERFATSKLVELADFSVLRTFGFRGEALAALSIAAGRLQITSRPATAPYAHRAEYKDGKMLSAEPTTSAGELGTQIVAERLFEATPARKTALMATKNEEAQRVDQLLAQYALLHPEITFAFSRSGRAWRVGGEGSSRAKIASELLGEQCGKDLIEFEHVDDRLKIHLTGCISPPTSVASALTSTKSLANTRRSFLLLIFVNGRPVEFSVLRKMVKSVFDGTALTTSLLMINIEVNPSRVDVNVHSSKKDVQFLEQRECCASISQYIDKLLRSRATESTQLSYSQPSTSTKLPAESLQIQSKPRQLVSKSTKTTNSQSPVSSQQRVAHEQIRTDARSQTLDSFVEIVEKTGNRRTTTDGSEYDSFDEIPVIGPGSNTSLRRVPRTLPSENVEPWERAATELRDRIFGETDEDLLELIQRHCFVAAVRHKSGPLFVLLQHERHLWRLEHDPLMEAIFKQQFLMSLGKMGAFVFSKNADDTDDNSQNRFYVDELLEMANEDAESRGELAVSPASCIEKITQNSSILDSIFALKFSANNAGRLHLCTIPSVLHAHVPSLEFLPDFVRDLCLALDRVELVDRLHSVVGALARWFSRASGEKSFTNHAHVDRILTLAKRNFLPPKSLRSVLQQLTDLKRIYQHFERC